MFCSGNSVLEMSGAQTSNYAMTDYVVLLIEVIDGEQPKYLLGGRVSHMYYKTDIQLSVKQFNLICSTKQVPKGIK